MLAILCEVPLSQSLDMSSVCQRCQEWRLCPCRVADVVNVFTHTGLHAEEGQGSRGGQGGEDGAHTAIFIFLPWQILLFQYFKEFGNNFLERT